MAARDGANPGHSSTLSSTFTNYRTCRSISKRKAVVNSPSKLVARAERLHRRRRAVGLLRRCKWCRRGTVRPDPLGGDAHYAMAI